MAYTTINKSTDYFTPHIWSGTNSNHTESIGMQPDLVWVKGRSVATDHTLFDAVRGPFGNGNSLSSNTTAAEGGSNTTAYGGISGVTSDGFTVTAGSGNADYVNTSGRTYASWNWKANGTGSANTDGSISSTVSANTTAGFSIVKVSKPNTSVATIGHGLGVTPKFIIGKDLDGVDNWTCYNEALGNGKGIYLNATNAEATASTFWNSTSPTSSVFTIGSDNTWNSPSMVFYCFADVQGYSKFGSYLGNSADDGTFVYTGFKPALIMVKRINSTGNWVMHDNRRSLSNGFNVNQYILYSNSSSDEITDESKVDLLSNGFKFRNALTDQNANGSTYIYMAFAEAPLVGTNGVTAKAR